MNGLQVSGGYMAGGNEYGANAAGKTKMLEALQFYMSFLLSSFNELEPNEKIDVIPFKFDPHFQNSPSEFELIVYIKDTETAQYIRYEYNLQLTTEKVLYESLFYAPKGQKNVFSSEVKTIQ